jgi:hypothetical protein
MFTTNRALRHHNRWAQQRKVNAEQQTRQGTSRICSSPPCRAGGWCLAPDGPVGPAGVVVGGEAVELGLRGADGGGWPLAGEPFLQGLMEAFYLAAGLGG